MMPEEGRQPIHPSSIDPNRKKDRKVERKAM
jgi:hypothetical protein